MPTADDLIAIDSMRKLAADIRGAGQAHAEGQIGAAGILEGRQQDEKKMVFQRGQLKAQMMAAQEAAEKSRNFREKEGEKSRASAEKIAGIRSGNDATTINIKNILAADDRTTTEDLVDSNILKTEEGPDGGLIITGVTETAESQANMIRRTVINLDSMSDEDWSNPERIANHNKNMQKIIDGVKKEGKSSDSGIVAAFRVLQIPKGANKASYRKNISAFWSTLVNRETGRLRSAQGKTPPTARAPGRPRRTDEQFLSDVIDSFGGNLPE